MDDEKNSDKSWTTNKLKDVVIEEIKAKQKNEFKSPGFRNRWRMEKEWKPLVANKNLVIDQLKYTRFETLYNREGYNDPMPPMASFQIVKNGKRNHIHCHENRSLWNYLLAFFDRQVATLNFPEPRVIKIIGSWMSRQLENWQLPELKYKTVKQWLQDHDQWGKSKITKYRNEIAKQLRDEYPEGHFKNEFDFTVKNLEMYNSYEAEVDDFIIRGVPDRARAIMAIKACMQGVIAWMQHIAFQWAKHNLPEFVQGENSKKFHERTCQELQKMKDPVCLSMDGGSHDSHQHSSLIEAIDHQVWLKFKPEVYKFLIWARAKNPDRLIKDVYSLILNNLAQLNFRAPGGQSLGHVKIKGTVFSGSPVLTTFGNTLRVIHSIKFMMEHARIDPSSYVLRVAGDDAVMWVERKDLKTVQASIKRLYSTDKGDRQHGLGQVLEIQVSEPQYAEFCSKVLIAIPGLLAHGQWVRKPESILYKGQRYTGSEAELKDPQTYSKTWAESLRMETQGPIWREIGIIRWAMGGNAIPRTTTNKYNLICKNDWLPELDQHYINAFAYYMGMTFWRAWQYYRYLCWTIMNGDVFIGMELLDPWDDHFNDSPHRGLDINKNVSNRLDPKSSPWQP